MLMPGSYRLEPKSFVEGMSIVNSFYAPMDIYGSNLARQYHIPLGGIEECAG
jgi:hypothetical protein